jgi:hypothetical protein
MQTAPKTISLAALTGCPVVLSWQLPDGWFEDQNETCFPTILLK